MLHEEHGNEERRPILNTQSYACNAMPLSSVAKESPFQKYISRREKTA